MPKDIRFLTQRRRNQIINRDLRNEDSILLHSQNSTSYSTLSNVASNIVEEAANINTNSENFCTNSTLFNDTDQSEESSIDFQLENNDICTFDEENNIPTLTDSNKCNNNLSLREDLHKLIIERNVPHNTANELLRILRKHGHTELPCDVRALVNTPRNASVNIKRMGNGRYAHFGLTSALERSIKIYSQFIETNKIKININVDGLPISKSSNSQFWPIMVSIEDIGIRTLPFVIGIHGMCKPSDANDFLSSLLTNFCFFLKMA